MPAIEPARGVRLDCRWDPRPGFVGRRDPSPFDCETSPPHSSGQPPLLMHVTFLAFDPSYARRMTPAIGDEEGADIVSNLEPTSSASTTDASRATTDGGRRVIKWLMAINLGLVALQPISAGFLLSGYDHASTIHAAVAAALQLVAVIQGVTAIVLWLRRRVSGRVAGLCVGLFVMVFLEVWAGRNREFWLHVPIGVGVLVWLRGRMDRLDTLWRT